MKPLLPLLAAAFLATFLAAILPARAEQAPRPVKLMTVAAPSVQVSRQFFGRVTARQTVDLAFQTAGQIVQFPAIEGQVVEAGGMIAQLDLEPFELALDQARLQRDRARRRAERLRQLEGHSVSRENVEDASTEAGLADIALRNAESALEHATLLAPFDALVAHRSVANFATVNAGTPVVRLHDMSELRIEINVPEVLFQRAGGEQDFTIVAQFPARATQYPVELREFNAETSRVGQTFRVTLGMPPPADVTILPGSSATIRATRNTAASPPLLPAAAVALGADGATSVLVFRPTEGDEGVVEARPVVLEVDSDGEFRVVEGLAAGEEIVAAGVHLLADGARVRRYRGLPG